MNDYSYDRNEIQCPMIRLAWDTYLRRWVPLISIWTSEEEKVHVCGSKGKEENGEECSRHRKKLVSWLLRQF